MISPVIIFMYTVTVVTLDVMILLNDDMMIS